MILTTISFPAVEKDKVGPVAEVALSVRFLPWELFIDGNMRMRTIAIMLRGLSKLNFDVVTDPRTLLGTPGVAPEINLHNAIYIHFCLKEYMQKFLKKTLVPPSLYRRIANSPR